MVSLEEAQKRVPAKIALPDYLPAGTVLKGIIIFPAPPDNPEKKFGEINLYYTNGIQIAEYPRHQPFDIKAFLDNERKNLPYEAPDEAGKRHIPKKIRVKGKEGLGQEQYDQVMWRGEKSHVSSIVDFDMEGSGGFEYLLVGVLGENLPLDEVLNIAESMEYPK